MLAQNFLGKQVEKQVNEEKLISKDDPEFKEHIDRGKAEHYLQRAIDTCDTVAKLEINSPEILSRIPQFKSDMKALQQQQFGAKPEKS